MGKWTKEELTCPECGFVAKDKRGLNGHRQFKHGVHPTAQLPLQKQDLLVSQSKLEQQLDERFAVISEQVDALNGSMQELAEAANSKGERILALEQRLSAAERKTMDDFTPREKAEFVIPWMQGLDAEDFVRLALETGHEAQLVPANDPAAVSILAEIMRKQSEAPKVIQGRTTRKGYKYLEHLKLSVKEG